MKTTIKATKLDISEAIRSALDKKIILPIERLLKKNDVVNLDLEVARTTQHHRHGDVFYAEANLKLGKVFLRAEANSSDIFDAINILHDALLREIKHFLDKQLTKERRSIRKVTKSK
jgi:ribosomal subunit interface protein